VVQAAETALRDAIGQSDLDQLPKERAQVNARLLEILGQTTDAVRDRRRTQQYDRCDDSLGAVARCRGIGAIVGTGRINGGSGSSLASIARLPLA
jgi:regulator of protease activity HflC (stomatin/prohibitin superfamily)